MTTTPGNQKPIARILMISLRNSTSQTPLLPENSMNLLLTKYVPFSLKLSQASLNNIQKNGECLIFLSQPLLTKIHSTLMTVDERQSSHPSSIT